MKGSAALVILSLAIWSCAKEPSTQTAVDAVELGYMPNRCSGRTKVTVFIMQGSMQKEVACTALDAALSFANERGIVPPGSLVPDSVALAVVDWIRFARTAARPAFPDSGLAVTIDLRGQQNNILVMWPGIDSSIDVGWVPKGLKY